MGAVSAKRTTKGQKSSPTKRGKGIWQGNKYSGMKEAIEFLVSCIKQDHKIIDDKIVQKEAENVESWDISIIELDDDSFDFAFIPTFYKSNLREENVRTTYHLFMPNYDTGWRFNIYVTFDDKFYLSENNPN